MQSSITAKGQITLPKAMREYLGVVPGDRVKFFQHPDGSVVILPKLPIQALAGMLKGQGKPASLEEMDEGLAAGVTDRYRSSAR